MRLARLDLTRYGKFTDQSIDFGPAPAGAPDFHIIYGLNEAGKSTTFAAFLDLLFGIPERSPYNFIHPYNTMQVGAVLEFGGAGHTLKRLKQRTGSLIDERGQPVNEALLASALGGIGRDAYRTMFSLDDQSLKEGGNAIIQSKGELGELLFSASTGLAGLSRSLVTAAEDAAALYKKRSSSTRLADLKRTLDGLKAERTAIDTFATAYAALVATAEQTSASYDAAMIELAAARARHGELNRILGALPLAADLARLSSTLAAMGDLPRPPAEWFSLLPRLARDETRLQALLESADRTIDQLAADIADIGVDDKILGIAARIDALDKTRDRYRTATDDLPKRRLALAEQEGALATILVNLEQTGHAHPEALLVPASLTGIIRDLIETRSGVDAELVAAERELKRVREGLARLREEAEAETKTGGAIDPDLLSRIETALSSVSGSELPARLALEERNSAHLRRLYESQCAGLAPWSGDGEALRATRTVETRQLETWRAQAAAIDQRLADHGGRLRDLGTLQAQRKARIAAYETNGPMDDGEAGKLRSDRDQAWKEHLEKLDLESARAFEDRMHQHDRLCELRLSRTQDLADLRQLKQDLATDAAVIERHEHLLAEARAESTVLADRIAAFLPHEPAEATAFDRLLALESWAGRRAHAIAAWDALRQGEGDREQTASELAARTAELATALKAAGIDGRTDWQIADVTRAATDLVSRIRSRKDAETAQRKALADLGRDLSERERNYHEAKASADSWRQRWEDAVAKTWFADKAPSVPAVREILIVLATLPGVLREREQMSQRIATMERDQASFSADVAAIVDELDRSIKPADPLAAADALLARRNDALRALQSRAGKQAELDRLVENRRQLDEQMTVHNAGKEQLTAFFDTDTLAAVSQSLEQVQERGRIETRIAEMRQQIAQALRVPTFEEADQRLAETDIAEVEQSAMELSARIGDLEERTRLLYADMTRARDKLDAVGGDDAVARIEAKRRTIFVEIEDLAVRYLTLRAGTLAAEQALHIYREKHRSSMMNRASEAFRMITGGSYSGLATRPDKDKEILIGVSRDGGSKLADAMSTGTQFQLYLALRLAGYEEFAAVRPAVPFIADDIMESFDDPRSEEVFRLLGDMAGVGQVIYLTHHKHLCEIARSVVPGVRIHELA